MESLWEPHHPSWTKLSLCCWWFIAPHKSSAARNRSWRSPTSAALLLRALWWANGWHITLDMFLLAHVQCHCHENRLQQNHACIDRWHAATRSCALAMKWFPSWAQDLNTDKLFSWSSTFPVIIEHKARLPKIMNGTFDGEPACSAAWTVRWPRTTPCPLAPCRNSAHNFTTCAPRTVRQRWLMLLLMFNWKIRNGFRAHGWPSSSHNFSNGTLLTRVLKQEIVVCFDESFSWSARGPFFFEREMESEVKRSRQLVPPRMNNLTH